MERAELADDNQLVMTQELAFSTCSRQVNDVTHLTSQTYSVTASSAHVEFPQCFSLRSRARNDTML